MGFTHTVPTGGRPPRAATADFRIRGSAMATGGLLVLMICALLNAAVLGNADTGGSLGFGLLIGMYMLAYGIVKRLSLSFPPRPGTSTGDSREHHPAD
ncbi:MAG: hypothetical protein ACTHWW_09255 [Arthrobacter sp.]|uniref:hypothetical protein n=1 Tax=unclassified Arthrobacter TaxID=235627 RepID=UPI00264EE336|nr:hypothetical protein [Micrococcaceae bacterium]MDN5812473.1 hypothetical protein [Micrococcaceae bacterium]MDN5825219.1 hypothetical protein [Micrococcaceae bacterium]MDN5879936.1 hypothetical protein [Micrococcaceae bacterium]MDN5887355.1 hypothetical protein [Micrococcaceae bacterium]